MQVVAVIPARYGSTRFPAKMLARRTGKYLVQHVWEQVKRGQRVDRVIIATDDERIAAAAGSFDAEVRMTRSDHPSGTDRVGEVAKSLGLAGDDLVINVQGDEPELDPRGVDQLVAGMAVPGCPFSIGTLAAPFRDEGPRSGPGSPLDPACVKVVVDERGGALYFSRSLIPYPRDTGGPVDRPSRWLLHVGVYAFRCATLQALTGSAAAPVELERAESLEQLRWLVRGERILVERIDRASPGIDTPEDYAAFVVRASRASGANG